MVKVDTRRGEMPRQALALLLGQAVEGLFVQREQLERFLRMHRAQPGVGYSQPGVRLQLGDGNGVYLL